MIRLLALVLYEINAAVCKAGVFPVCGGNFKSYNSTFLPNLLGQWSMNEIEMTSSTFYPLKAVQCSAHLELFLCSVLSPACVNENPEGVLPYLIPVPPCRSLCNKVLSECGATIEEFGIDLPSSFDCDKFPIEHGEDDHPCIPIQSHHDPLPDGTLRWRQTQSLVKKASSATINKNQCPHHLVSDKQEDVFAGITQCKRPCKPIESDESQTSVFRLMLAVFSVISAIITSFSIIIFLRDRKRFIYPERPTLYFSVCYLAISLAVMAGLISPEKIACNAVDRIDQSDIDPGLAIGTESTKCTVVFTVIYFFANAALSWWVILILIWGLSIIFEWNLDLIEHKGAYFHIFAWSTPSILTILAVYNERIKGDSTLGICVLDDSRSSLYFFSLLPVVIITTIGVVVFLLGLRRLMRLRQSFTINFESQARLEQFVFRISSFSLAFILPQINGLVIKMYESHMKPSWEETWFHDNCAELGLPCPKTTSPAAYMHPALILLKYILFIIPAWAPLIWVVNGKALRGWGLNSNSSLSTSNESFKTNSLDKSSLTGSHNSRHDRIHLAT